MNAEWFFQVAATTAVQGAIYAFGLVLLYLIYRGLR